MSDSDEDTLLEALEETKETIEKDPTHVAAHFTQGSTYFKLDEFETAVKVLKSGLALAKKSTKEEEKALVSKFEMWIRKCNTNLNPDDTSVEVKEAPKDEPKAEDKPAATPADVAAAPPVRKSPVRHEWYQTPKEVVVTFFAKKREEKHVKVNFQPREVEVVIELNEGQEFQHTIDPLYKEIVPAECSWKISPYKLECKLVKKQSGLQWQDLEGKGEDDGAGVTMNDKPETRPSYPSSSRKKTNWDSLNAECKKEEEEEKPEGDAALTKLFQDIYGKADDDTKRAMMKSYVESGGTVLSTNWDEIGSKKTEATPPKGMEWASWDKRAAKDAGGSHYERPEDDDGEWK
eukprot:TRINITY_DN64131_c0_g3_i1.p2 TRINITY_DN64131_c0_g3~~TRINITY_DN64131_c0_g3_i1.p2  ORF type:complete len:347 (+),score=80.00 TRINITY_DN64131_c0_g3_i1:36-1076(+)